MQRVICQSSMILPLSKFPFFFGIYHKLPKLPGPLPRLLQTEGAEHAPAAVNQFLRPFYLLGPNRAKGPLQHHLRSQRPGRRTRVFDTSVIKKVPLSLVIGLFFCQLFCFTI